VLYLSNLRIPALFDARTKRFALDVEDFPATEESGQGLGSLQ